MVDNASFYTTQSQQSPATAQSPFPDDHCIEVIFSQLEYVPWDNPDNIVSAEVEIMVRRLKDNLLALLFFIGGPANLINMAVFYKQGLKHRVNLCLFALALADELYLISSLVFYGEQLYIQLTTKERFGPFTTLLTDNNGSVIIGFGFVSPILSAIIAAERCLCVFSPLKFQSLVSTKTTAAIIIAVYVLVLGMFSVVVFRYRVGCVYDPTSGVVMKTLVQGTFYAAHKQFIDRLDSYVFGIGLSGLEMLVVVTATVLTVVKLRQAVRWRSGQSSSISAREVALTKMLVGNSIFFIACVSFNNLYRFTWLFFPEVNAGRRKHNIFLTGLWVAEVCTYINSTFNILVYYSMGSHYRETFWELFGRHSTKPKSPAISPHQLDFRKGKVVEKRRFGTALGK